jgi:hypothetical protein
VSRVPRTGHDATHGAGWRNTLRWIDKQVEKTARTRPDIPAVRVRAMAAAAAGYATAPDYPEDDRNRIFRGMISTYQPG